MPATFVVRSRSGWAAAAVIGAAHLALALALIERTTHVPEEAIPSMVYMDVFKVVPPVPAAAARMRMPVPRSTARTRERVRRRAEPKMVTIHNATVAVQEAPVIAPDLPAATAETEAIPGLPRLDVAGLRAAAGEMERRRQRSPLELVREGQRVRSAGDNAAQRAISKAKRADCRSAYGGGTTFNVLALIPLAVDTVTDTGCKW